MKQNKSVVVKVKAIEAFELYKKGLGYTQIAEKMGISKSTARDYINRVLQEIAEVSTTEITVLRAEIKERLLHLVAEALQGWEGSKEFTTKKVKKFSKEGTESVSQEVEVAHGDVRYLQVAKEAIATIVDLYGVAPTKQSGGTEITQLISNDNGEVTVKTSWGVGPVKKEPKQVEVVEVEAKEVVENHSE